MRDWLQETADSVGPLVQALVIFLGGMIPLIESYLGSVIGVLSGMPLVPAVLTAVLGNFLAVVVLVAFVDQIRTWRKADEKPLTPRQERFRRAFDKYGVPGVSLIGQTILPSQLTSMLLVGFGASRGRVLFWQGVSITLWGALFGTLTALGLAYL